MAPALSFLNPCIIIVISCELINFLKLYSPPTCGAGSGAERPWLQRLLWRHQSAGGGYGGVLRLQGRVATGEGYLDCDRQGLGLEPTWDAMLLYNRETTRFYE